MRIAVCGAGPAGLAFAAFVRLAVPESEVTVWERHRVAETYGFGVILPPNALDAVRRADAPLADKLARRLVTWERIAVRRHRRSLVTRAPLLGALSRQTLLLVLRQRCAELGVRLHEGARAPDAASLSSGYDLVVAADGTGSTIRTGLAKRFGTTIQRTAPDYAWLGADRSFDSLTFLVSDTPRGPVVAHVYPYEPGRSSFLVEAAFRPTVDELSELFAEQLPGARLLENQSRWSRFPQVRNTTWAHGNVVLIGDAAHTAHYSVGSGTRLALDDARALSAALRAKPSLPAALAAYETSRRPAVEHTQRVGRESAAWFAGLADAGPSSPEEFLVDLVTRGGRISMGDLTAGAGGGAPAGTVVSGR